MFSCYGYLLDAMGSYIALAEANTVKKALLIKLTKGSSYELVSS
jgi:hypothetical protein